jgi:sulfite exporter TauE/SafE
LVGPREEGVVHGSSEILLVSVATIALVHTVIGPDHYLPFIVLARAEGWPLRKTLAWTLLAGVGHVLSSILIGLAGGALGWALSSMQRFESARGQLAAYGLIGFGLVYFVWGMWRARRGGHSHVHLHADGSLHDHPHAHDPGALGAGGAVEAGGQGSDHNTHARAHRRTAWTLFAIFVLGPCEPLIPLLMAPAARHDLRGAIAIATLFGVVTIGAMLVLVAVGTLGVRLLRLQRLERHVHALAGFTILVSGILIQVLGV